MSRRHRGLGRRLLTLVDFAWRVALSWLLWPFYAVADFFGSTSRGYRSALARRGWRQILLDYLLFLPRWIGIFLAWVWQAVVTWPRVMRLRDLASGLPALLVTIAAVVILLIYSLDEKELIGSYQQKSIDAYEQAWREKDRDLRIENLKLAQFYSRALVKLKPDDPTYRFNVGHIYQELGEYERSQAIMDSLAPRDAVGLAKAHIWQADQFLSPDRPLTSEALDAAEAHLLRALPTYDQKEEVHRRLGELYYYRYVHYKLDPRQPAREPYLAKADYHLSQVAAVDTKLRLTLAEIRSLQGRAQEALLDVQGVAAQLSTRLKSFPDDLDSRILLARAYRMLRRFADAAEVLREGQSLRPDPRYDQELSTTYYYQSHDVRQRNPAALADQFAALHAAYLSHPTNNYVAYRFVQALTSTTPEEVEIARRALQDLVDKNANAQIATFLLGFDCLRKNLPTKAESYFDAVRKMPPDASPQVIAGMSLAVFSEQLKSVNPAAVRPLFDAALRVWPTDPDLLTVRAQQNVVLKNFSSALDDLQQAVKSRPYDAKLHEMLSIVYQQLGQSDLARKHKHEAESLRTSNSQP